jgi:hypothetical protein
MSAMRATVRLTRSRPPPLSRITDGNGNDGSTFGTAACQYVSEDGRLVVLELSSLVRNKSITKSIALRHLV